MLRIDTGKPVSLHFDHHRVIRDDDYSGQYQPIEYSSRFDDQWRLSLERRVGFCRHTDFTLCWGVVMLNQDEPHKCAYHMLGRKTG